MESLAWKSDSQLWADIRKSNQELPRFEDTALPGSIKSADGAKPAQKPEKVLSPSASIYLFLLIALLIFILYTYIYLYIYTYIYFIENIIFRSIKSHTITWLFCCRSFSIASKQYSS